jgi:predicted methyltransferase
MIPQNTIVITKEMINQFGLEITEMQSEFERYNSWLNPFQFQLIGVIGKLKLFTKNWSKVASRRDLVSSRLLRPRA